MSDISPVPLAAAVMDPAQALRFVGGDSELLEVLMVAFLAHLPKGRQRLREGLSARNSADLLLATHTLRGTATTFAAAAAVGAVRAFEQAIRDAQWEEAGRTFALLEIELARLEEVLRNSVPSASRTT